MASSKKKVTLDVAVKTEQNNLDALDKKLDDAKRKAAELKQQKIEMKVNADTQSLTDVTQKLNQAESKLNQMKSNKLFFATDTDAPEKLQQAQAEVNKLKQQQIDLQVQVESYKLDELQSKKDAIEADEINVQLNNQSAMEGLNQIVDGFSRVKSAASEVGQQFGDLLSSAGKQETNFAFLKNAVGDAELARQKMSEINDIVAKLPGDDTALQGLLSSAAAKDSSLTADNLRSMANSATDYFSAMSYYGKSATEAQQDMTNYLLAGNTAELERSPILQGHIDKLKQATTVQERSKALAEALNEEHWAGMGAMDTYNNKLETFNGMIERGRYTLGGMFQEGAKGAMDFLLKLDEGTNGLVGMTIAAGGFLSPMTDALMGLGQMATGINAIKETKLGEWASNVKDKIGGIGNKIKSVDSASKFNSLKQGLISLGTKAKDAAVSIGTTLWASLKSAASAAKDAAVWLGKAAIEVLKGGWNALKAAGMWLAEKAAKLASEAASKLAAAAQWLLNAAMSANPITLIIIAIVALVGILWYLYNTCEPVHDAIDGIWAGVSSAIQPIVDSVQWLIDKLTQLANGDWSVTIDIMKAGASAGVDAGMDMANNDLSRGIVGALMGDEALTQIDEQMPAFKEKVSTSINEMLDAVWNDGTQGFLGWLGNIAGIDVGSYLTGFQTSIDTIPQWVNQAGQGAIQGFKNMYDGAAQWLNNIITQVASFVSQIVPKFASAASQSVNNFINGIRQMPGMVAGELDRIWQNVVNWGQNLANKFSEIGGEAYNALKRALGIGSPGYMFYMMEGELGRIEHIMENNEIPSKAEVLGKNLISAWNNPQLDLDGEFSVDKVDGKNDNISSLETLLTKILEALSRQSGDTYQFTLNGDVDNEERMQKFLDAVRRELEWNNATAGRDIV